MEPSDNATAPPCQSPPPAAQPPRQDDDPAARLHQLARALLHNRSRAALLEYLRLRKACR